MDRLAKRKRLLTAGVLFVLMSASLTLKGSDKSNIKSSQPSESLHLQESVNRVTISGRDSLTLTVLLKNTTKKPVYVVESNPLADYQIDVRDERGQPATPTDEGKVLLMRALWAGRRVSVLIRPGEEKRDTFEINKIYRMNAGTYTIMTTRSVILQTGVRHQIKSNGIKITVTP